MTIVEWFMAIYVLMLVTILAAIVYVFCTGKAGASKLLIGQEDDK